MRKPKPKFTERETEALQRAIAAAGSQRELAKRMRVTEGTVSRWSAGHYPREYHREQWLVALGEVRP
jgi:hypothetical protein